ARTRTFVPIMPAAAATGTSAAAAMQPPSKGSIANAARPISRRRFRNDPSALTGALLTASGRGCPVPKGSVAPVRCARRFTDSSGAAIRAPMADSLTLELADFEHMVHTGIYSEETG